MTEVWVAATDFEHADRTPSVTVPVTVEGSSRATCVHDLLQVRSADVPYARDERKLRSHIRKLNEEIDARSPEEVDPESAVKARCEIARTPRRRSCSHTRGDPLVAANSWAPRISSINASSSPFSHRRRHGATRRARTGSRSTRRYRGPVARDRPGSHARQQTRPPWPKGGTRHRTHGGGPDVQGLHRRRGGRRAAPAQRCACRAGLCLRPRRAGDSAAGAACDLRADSEAARPRRAVLRDFASLLRPCVAVRERIDWDQVCNRTADDDFAAAFLVLADRLGITG